MSPGIIDARLVDGALYLMLFIRSDTIDSGFHWATYHHLDQVRGGVKRHIKGSNENGWFYEAAQTRSVLKEFLLLGLMRIGHATDDGSAIENAMKSVPHSSGQAPEGYDVLTCRTWLLAVLRVLQEDGVVQLASIAELEKEAWAWGAQELEGAFMARQPRPVTDSITFPLNC